MLTGVARRKYEEDLRQRTAAAVRLLRATMERGALGVDAYMLCFSPDDKTVRRKHAGVRFQENGKALRVVKWLPGGGRMLAFKVPSTTGSTRGYPDYYPGVVVVGVVSEEPYAREDDEEWFLFWELIDWAHERGAYANPERVSKD